VHDGEASRWLKAYGKTASGFIFFVNTAEEYLREALKTVMEVAK